MYMPICTWGHTKKDVCVCIHMYIEYMEEIMCVCTRIMYYMHISCIYIPIFSIYTHSEI